MASIRSHLSSGILPHLTCYSISHHVAAYWVLFGSSGSVPPSPGPASPSAPLTPLVLAFTAHVGRSSSVTPPASQYPTPPIPAPLPDVPSTQITADPSPPPLIVSAPPSSPPLIIDVDSSSDDSISPSHTTAIFDARIRAARRDLLSAPPSLVSLHHRSSPTRRLPPFRHHRSHR